MTNLVVFVGRSLLAKRTVEYLLHHACPIHCLVVDGYHHSGQPQNVALSIDTSHQPLPWYAHQTALPVIGTADDTAIATLAEQSVSHLVSVCFPRRIDAQLLSLATLGNYNLHPSLLPLYRGSAPVFWQLKRDEQQWGVTVHQLTSALDAGPVLLQQVLPAPSQTDAAFVDHWLAQAAGRALLAVLDATPVNPLWQCESQATWHPWPQAADFILESAWTLERALRFVRGTLHWQMPYSMQGILENVSITDARPANSMDGVCQKNNTDRCLLRFYDGVMDVRLRGHDRASNRD